MQLLLAFLFAISVLLSGTGQQRAAFDPKTFVKAVSAAPQPPATNAEFFLDLDSVHLIRCGNMIGTAETVYADTLMTASHVVKNESTCRIGINGEIKTAVVVYDDNAADYAILRVETADNPRFPLDCRGFVTGEPYFLVGYADGSDFVVSRLTATRTFGDFTDNVSGQEFKHARVLRGVGRTGMSGGPIVDRNGVMVGIIVAGPRDLTKRYVYARELRDTILCKEKSRNKSR